MVWYIKSRTKQEENDFAFQVMKETCDESTGFISPSNRSFFILVHTGGPYQL